MTAGHHWMPGDYIEHLTRGRVYPDLMGRSEILRYA